MSILWVAKGIQTRRRAGHQRGWQTEEMLQYGEVKTKTFKTFAATWQPAGGDKPPLLCVHARGGHVLNYHDLVRHLGGDQPVYGIQARGLDGKTPPHKRIEDMAADYLREIRAVQPEGPYYLAGLSFAGVVIFEMAQQLRAKGEEVALLAMLDTGLPGHKPPLARRIAARLKRLWKRGPFSVGRMLSRPAPAPPRPATPPVPTLLEEIERINVAAARRYVPRAYLGRVTLFRTMDKDAEWDLGEDLGWRKYARGGLEIHDVPGDHDTFHILDANVKVLAKSLRACLERAQHGYARVAV